jgi:hypothetical protein
MSTMLYLAFFSPNSSIAKPEKKLTQTSGNSITGITIILFSAGNKSIQSRLLNHSKT